MQSSADRAPRFAPCYHRRVASLPPLDPAETRRYGRHLVLPEIGPEGQRRLKGSSVLVVGAGGLGAPASLYLAAAGIGRLGIVDFDAVEESNLQRQVLYATTDVGRPKIEAATARLRALNPAIAVEAIPARLDAGNAEAILAGWDVVVDGSDNFPTRYLVNDACSLRGIPYVYGSIFRFEGQASVFWKGHGPCYRCLHPEPPAPGAVPNCAEGGVLGVLPGVIGSIQACETIKIALGLDGTLAGRLLLFDALSMRFREMAITRDPACALCGDHPTITTLRDLDAACEVSVPGDEEMPAALSVDELRSRLASGRKTTLLDVRSPQEWAICRIEGARLVPLPTLPTRLGELSREDEIVVYCHVGVRSARAAAFLRREGFPRVANLSGGIDAWAVDVDPAMPRY